MKQIFRSLPLLVAISAVACWATPAIAQAEGPFWYVGGEKVESPVPYTSSGKLTFTTQVAEGISVGIECEFSFEGNLENGEESAEGTIHSKFFGAVCPMNPPWCTAEVFPGGQPWNIVTGPEGQVSWQSTSFGASFSMFCVLGKGAAWSGDLNGQWNSETGCMEFENAGELVVSGSGKAMVTDGKTCLTAKAGTITLE